MEVFTEEFFPTSLVNEVFNVSSLSVLVKCIVLSSKCANVTKKSLRFVCLCDGLLMLIQDASIVLRQLNEANFNKQIKFMIRVSEEIV
jgi:hypothetical protein